MSSIRNILESLDDIEKKSTTNISTATILESEEDLLLKEWTEFKKQELNEFLPALAAVGGALARGASAVGGALARGVASTVKTVGQTAAQSAGSAIGQSIADKVTGQTTTPTTTTPTTTTPTTTTPQQKQQQTDQEKQVAQQTKATATNLQALKSATGANINIPAATTSLVKAVAGQPISTTDSKNLSGISGAFHTALTNPNTAKQLVDIVKRATIQK